MRILPTSNVTALLNLNLIFNTPQFPPTPSSPRQTSATGHSFTLPRQNKYQNCITHLDTPTNPAKAKMPYILKCTSSEILNRNQANKKESNNQGMKVEVETAIRSYYFFVWPLKTLQNKARFAQNPQILYKILSKGCLITPLPLILV